MVLSMTQMFKLFFLQGQEEKVALILVDIQNDFLEKGSLAVANSNIILKPVNELIEKIKSRNGLIIATQVTIKHGIK